MPLVSCGSDSEPLLDRGEARYLILRVSDYCSIEVHSLGEANDLITRCRILGTTVCYLEVLIVGLCCTQWQQGDMLR